MADMGKDDGSHGGEDSFPSPLLSPDMSASPAAARQCAGSHAHQPRPIGHAHQPRPQATPPSPMASPGRVPGGCRPCALPCCDKVWRKPADPCSLTWPTSLLKADLAPARSPAPLRRGLGAGAGSARVWSRALTRALSRALWACPEAFLLSQAGGQRGGDVAESESLGRHPWGEDPACCDGRGSRPARPRLRGPPDASTEGQQGKRPASAGAPGTL